MTYPPPPHSREITPSRWYYGLGVLIIALGVCWFVSSLVKDLRGLTDNMLQVVAPGKSDINLSEAGKYTIFHEYRSVVDGKVYSGNRSVSGLRCALKSKATNARIPISPSSADYSYSMPSRSGASVLEFVIDRPGEFEFSAYYPEGSGGPEVVLSIDHGFLRRLLEAILKGFAILFGSLCLGIVVVVLTFVKRRKTGRRWASGPRSL